MKSFLCKDEEATKKIGQQLGTYLQDGDVVCLTGDLGRGKTTLVKAMCAAQGVKDSDVTSPSFALLNLYQGKTCPLKHFDLYRLNSKEELEDIGFADELYAGGISFIEWGELFLEELPQAYLQIIITDTPQGRMIELRPYGKHYEEFCEKVSTC